KANGACTVCQKAKTRCQFEPGADACRKCIKIGNPNGCIPQPSRTRSARGSSLPPEDPAVVPGSQAVIARKRASSTTSSVIAPIRAKQTKRSTLQPPQAPDVQPRRSNKFQLHSIAEDEDEEDADVLFPLNKDSGHSANSDRVKEFLSALSVPGMACTGGGPGNTTSVFFSELDDDEGSEDFSKDIENVSASENSESEGSEDEFLAEHLPAQRLVNKKLAAKPGATRDSKRKPSVQLKPERNSKPSYDPETCDFIIPCFILQCNRTNSPFELPSTMSYDNLRICIAEKLAGDPQPGLLQLQYRLEPNRKQPATSVLSEKELASFKTRMRPLLVPQLLANGQLSRSRTKNISVYFEDKMIADQIFNLSDGGKGKDGWKFIATELKAGFVIINDARWKIGQWVTEIMKDHTGEKVTIEKIPDLLWGQIHKYGMPKTSKHVFGWAAGGPALPAGPGDYNVHPAPGPHNPASLGPGGYSRPSEPGYYPPPPSHYYHHYAPWGPPDGLWYLQPPHRYHPSQPVAAYPPPPALQAPPPPAPETQQQPQTNSDAQIPASSSRSTSPAYS
ncbi:hypothetical protein BDN67DRAFT_1060763, partial [Paxillus ammoniavirescens]